MTVRGSMASLISTVRSRIGDTSDITQMFPDQAIQDALDDTREDIRYEPLAIAPSIVNLPSTGNTPSTIYADYYSVYQWWETDVVLQGNAGSLSWAVITPVTSEPIVGHWSFELTPFVNGTVPGQLPPVFATGKVYDPYAAAADLLEFWAAQLAGSYDITVDGQTLRRSQLMAAKLAMATAYRRKAKIRRATMVRTDVAPPMDSVRMRLLDSPTSAK
jgi:hypothetical protein